MVALPIRTDPMRPALRIAFAEVALLVATEAPLASQVRKRNGSGSVAAPLTAELLGMDAPAAVLLERTSRYGCAEDEPPKSRSDGVLKSLMAVAIS